jgi:hypothetical protein
MQEVSNIRYSILIPIQNHVLCLLTPMFFKLLWTRRLLKPSEGYVLYRENYGVGSVFLLKVS